MNAIKRHIFVGMSILANNQWLQDQAIIVEGKKIIAIIPKEMAKHHLPATVKEFPNNFFLIPGLIDLHIHGAAGFDVMDATQEALIGIAHALAKEGVTGFLATTVTADKEHLESVLKNIARYDTQNIGANMLGVHLEGPFIAKNFKGAQPNQMQLPNIELFKKWQRYSNNQIKIVTLAPELKGALDFISELQHMEIIASAGHTQANYDEIEKAIRAGCSQATHLFNAMRGMHQREPSATGALLLSEKIHAELIVDGVHVHPAMIDLAFKLKSKERLLLVTDAMRAKCLANGSYDFAEQSVRVSDGVVKNAEGTLAGSTLTMNQAIKNMMQFTRCSLADAVMMSSYNPAYRLKLTKQKGSVEVGKDADLVILNNNLDVIFTMREGIEIFAS